MANIRLITGKFVNEFQRDLTESYSLERTAPTLHQQAHPTRTYRLGVIVNSIVLAITETECGTLLVCMERAIE